jgi:response regulator RpfG family c-di-GMP phosphodiesterase
MEGLSNYGPHHSKNSSQSMQDLPLLKCRSIKGVNILVADNDADSRYLWTLLLEEYGAKVMAFESIKDALASLENFMPDLLICEIRFLGESVTPLIDRVKHISITHERIIPILITSTCSPANFFHFFHDIAVVAKAYLLKPIDIDDFVDTALNLVNLRNESRLRSYFL